MQLGVIAEGLGMQVQFFDVINKLPLGNARQVPSLNQLLASSDVVSLHVPETGSTHNMIGATQLAQMPRGSILINASRGTVVDIDALASSLESGHLGGAGIDVFPEEPRSNDEEFISPLRRFDNTFLTPHIGGSTVEAQANIGMEVAEKLARYSDNGTTTSSVNFPEVALPEHAGSHRLLHIHHNVPGMMSAINSVFSENNLNVSAQYLQTNEAIGYVVIDIDAEYSDMALAKLAGIDGTIRCRVLF
jgi:D-3-phosphoglycerate dehydrogenase